jgi:hypothetical protein
MPFQKNHKMGFTSDEPLDQAPVCLKVKSGVREKLRSIPRWQEKLRAYIDKLIEEEKPS